MCQIEYLIIVIIITTTMTFLSSYLCVMYYTKYSLLTVEASMVIFPVYIKDRGERNLTL